MNSNEMAVELKFEEFSHWREWIRNDLVLGGLDTPSEEICLLFATRAVTLTDTLFGHCDKMEDQKSIRNQLIQALILQLCWGRELELHKKSKLRQQLDPTLPSLEGRELIARKHNECVMEASDGHHYSVTFPSLGSETALATQMICLELARVLGLPVPKARLILVSSQLALRAGIHPDYAARNNSKSFNCLGTRMEPEQLGISSANERHLPISLRSSRYISGALMLNVLTLNLIPEELTFRAIDGHAEPFFRQFSHCLMDADWDRFVKAKGCEQVPMVFADKIKSYEQLETWIKRIEQIDFEHICEIAIKLPPEWYDYKPTLIAAVINKLSERSRDLRIVILRLIRIGRLPCIRQHAGYSHGRNGTA
jgi:hypothetical protein